MGLEVKDLMLFYENMLAVNNVSLKCAGGQIVGIFGANSAGKSSLMYAISGLILDIQKKEEMKGGERITVLGDILFNDENITALRPSERARRGVILCPERRRIFAESSAMENLKIGGYLASREQYAKTLDFVFTISSFGRTANPEALRRLPERRAAADAGRRPRPDGPAQAAAARRTASGAQPRHPVGPG
jgi:ABC-type branched-subunit amino acid transport system ATPase component